MSVFSVSRTSAFSPPSKAQTPPFIAQPRALRNIAVLALAAGQNSAHGQPRPLSPSSLSISIPAAAMPLDATPPQAAAAPVAAPSSTAPPPRVKTPADIKKDMEKARFTAPSPTGLKPTCGCCYVQ